MTTVPPFIRAPGAADAAPAPSPATCAAARLARELAELAAVALASRYDGGRALLALAEITERLAAIEARLGIRPGPAGTPPRGPR